MKVGKFNEAQVKIEGTVDILGGSLKLGVNTACKI